MTRARVAGSPPRLGVPVPIAAPALLAVLFLILPTAALIGRVPWSRLGSIYRFVSGEPAKATEAVAGDIVAFGRLDGVATGATLSPSGSAEALDSAASPRGYRLLAKVPRLPATVIDRLVEHFGGLQKLLAASVADLQAVEGVGETRARTVREGLSRLAESSILERYV